MSNMSYCRFQNTYTDLRDCFEAINEGKETSNEELLVAKRMLLKMAEFITSYNIVVDNEIDEAAIDRALSDMKGDDDEEDEEDAQ